jgi:hypothetical protein
MANMVSNSEISGGETIVGGLLVPIHATTLCAFVRAPLRSAPMDWTMLPLIIRFVEPSLPPRLHKDRHAFQISHRGREMR